MGRFTISRVTFSSPLYLHTTSQLPLPHLPLSTSFKSTVKKAFHPLNLTTSLSLLSVICHILLSRIQHILDGTLFLNTFYPHTHHFITNHQPSLSLLSPPPPPPHIYTATATNRFWHEVEHRHPERPAGVRRFHVQRCGAQGVRRD